MEYLNLYSPEQARRQEVKPGITGWAQVNGRNALGWRERFELDVWYVDHQSLWLDVKILLLTSAPCCAGRGSTQRATRPCRPLGETMPEGNAVYILGAGGHAKVVASTLLAAGYRGAGFFDDDAGKWGQTVLGLPVLGNLRQALRIEEGMAAVIGIGNNKRRREIATTYTNIKWLSIIHPRAHVHATVRLGRGNGDFRGCRDSTGRPDRRALHREYPGVRGSRL